MDTKKCDHCQEEKDKNDFYFGHRCCKKCVLDKGKQRREELKDQISSYKRQDRLKNPEKYKARAMRYHEKNKDINNKKRKQRYEKQMTNPEERERLRLAAQQWRKDNPEKWKETRKKHRHNSVCYRYSNSLRRRLNKFLNNKNFSISSLVGCSNEEFRLYLEKQFAPGMTWENYGIDGWHIDHIIPLSSAKGDLDQLKKLCHYTNLQPLWAEDNLKKSNRLIPRKSDPLP